MKCSELRLPEGVPLRTLLLLASSKLLEETSEHTYSEVIRLTLAEAYHYRPRTRDIRHHALATFLDVLADPRYSTCPDKLVHLEAMFNLIEGDICKPPAASNTEGIAEYVFNSLRMTRVDWMKEELTAAKEYVKQALTVEHGTEEANT